MTFEASSESVLLQIQEDFERHISRIQEAISIKSDTYDFEGHEKIAGYAASTLETLGCDTVEVVDTEGSPGVWAHYDACADVTIVHYAMLDTLPANNADEWQSDPFTGERTELAPYGEVIVGRITNKARAFAFVNALEAIKKTSGELPVNVLFLWETEETQGSPNYYQMLDRFDGHLAKSNACFTPGFGQNRSGEVYGPLGYKSAIFLKFSITGERWGRGPQGKNLHGMTNVLLDSPAWRLIEALSSLASNQKVKIDGYYEQYEPPTDTEREEIKQLIEELGEGDDVWKHLPGMHGEVKKLKDDIEVDPVEAVTRYFYRPDSFNLQGVRTGSLERFHLPANGKATLGIRLPRGYDPDITLNQIRQHLSKNGFSDINFERVSTHKWYQTDSDDNLVKATKETLEEHGVKTIFAPYSCGGLPVTAFGNKYDIPVVRGFGLGHQGTQGPNEFLCLEETENIAGLERSELSFAQIILRYISLK